jgi:hypothetical protein
VVLGRKSMCECLISEGEFEASWLRISARKSGMYPPKKNSGGQPLSHTSTLQMFALLMSYAKESVARNLSIRHCPQPKDVR